MKKLIACVIVISSSAFGQAISTSGGVQKSGTPSAAQVAVWNSSTGITGYSGLTFDGSGLVNIGGTGLNVNSKFNVSSATGATWIGSANAATGGLGVGFAPAAYQGLAMIGEGLVNTSTAYNLNPEADFLFGGLTDSNSNLDDWAAIGGAKSSTTSANPGGLLRFYTRTSGTPAASQNFTKALEIDAAQTSNFYGDINLLNPGTARIYVDKTNNRYIGYEASLLKVMNTNGISVNGDVQGYGAFIDQHFNRNGLGVHSAKQSYTSPGTEYGTATASANSVTVTFAQAFNNLSSVFCICTPIDSAGTHTCTMSAAPTNTAVTFKTSGATDVVHYMCMGRE